MKKSSLIVGTFMGLIFTAMGIFAAVNNFNDIPEDHWAKNAIENLKNVGVIQGYQDGTYKGDQMISRYEVAVMIDKNNAIWMNGIGNLERRMTELEMAIEPQENVSQLSALIKSGSDLEEIQNPHFTFPSDIHEGQIEKYFKMGERYFALVLMPSMNINFQGNIPWNEFTPTFSGVLISDTEGKNWNKLLEIKDTNESNFIPDASTGNNPYYFWKEAGELMLSIVDQNGAGSSEGFEKVYSTDNGVNWSLEGCYYFGPGVNNPDFGVTTDDYFAHSKDLDKFDKAEQSNKNCENDVTLKVYLDY